MKIYNEELVNAKTIDYCHLINLAGELLDYDKVTEEFDIPPKTYSLIELTQLRASISSCWEENKIYQSPDSHDLLSAF